MSMMVIANYEEMDEMAVVSLDQSEDAGLETLLSEGDEDALIISPVRRGLGGLVAE